MGFTKEKTRKIKRYILEKINNNQKDVAKRTAKSFEISLNTVYRYMRELEEENIIQKKEGLKGYELVTIQESFVFSPGVSFELEEDIIYNKYIKKYINHLPDNVQRIWEYSFMEMMNNAIDHSEAKIILVTVAQNYMNTTIFI